MALNQQPAPLNHYLNVYSSVPRSSCCAKNRIGVSPPCGRVTFGPIRAERTSHESSAVLLTDAITEPVDVVLNLVRASEQDMAGLVGLVAPSGSCRI